MNSFLQIIIQIGTYLIYRGTYLKLCSHILDAVDRPSIDERLSRQYMVSIDASTMFGVFGHTFKLGSRFQPDLQGKCCSSVSCQPVPQCVSISTSRYRYPPFSVVINISDRYLNRGPEIVQVTSTCTFFLMQQEVLLLTDFKVFFFE